MADIALWRRVLPLLETALEQAAESAPAWVEAQGLDDAGRNLLRSLLAERAQWQASGFLAEPPAIATAPGPALQPGQSIGPWRLVRELGQGGMSVVWLAERHDEDLRRTVALKLPHAGPGQEALAQRLQRERHILAGLNHPNIARLYDVGRTEAGLPFMVLEFVDGQPLTTYCREQRLDLHARLALFDQVLAAVQHAHGQLVLHRDLKPGNILVNAEGQVRLLDFGIAKLMDDASAEATELTRLGGRPLTPDYAAPEQIGGQTVGTAADVYALGVVLHELLTGERPYRLSRGTAGELEQAILNTPVRRASESWRDGTDTAALAFRSSPRHLRRQLRGDLDLVLLTALQKDPERRYPTADAFAQDLRRWRAREPVQARADSLAYRIGRFVDRNRYAVGAATAVVAALATGLGVALWQADRARLEAAKAQAINSYLVGLFESNSVEQADTLRKRQQSVQSLLVDSAQSLRQSLQDQPEVRDQMQAVVGRLLHDLSITDEAIAIRRERVAQQAAARWPMDERVQAVMDLVESLNLRGEFDAADQALADAARLCPLEPARASTPCLSLRVAQGVASLRQREMRSAADRLEPALAALQAQAPGSEALATAQSAMGELRALQNRPEEALSLFQQSSELRAQRWGPQSSRLARSRYDLAFNLWVDRHYALAEREFMAAHQTFATTLGAAHPTTALVQLQLGRLRMMVRNQGQRDIAEAVAVITTHSESLDPERVLEARLIEAEAVLQDGRLGEALRMLERLPVAESTVQDLTPDMQRRLQTLRMGIWQMSGRFDAVRETLHALRQQAAGTLGDTHPEVADIDFRLAHLDLAQGRLADARAGFERVLGSQGSREEVYGSVKHQARTGLARVAMAQGQFSLAWPIISAAYGHASRTPREERTALSVAELSDRMGQVLAGLGRHGDALRYFGESIQSLEGGYPHNPRLTLTRARLAASLHAMGREAEARAQWIRVDEALAAEPRVGPQYLASIAQARTMND